MYISRLVYSFIHQWTFGLLPHLFLFIVTSAAMNMGMQISLQDPAFYFFGFIPSSEIFEDPPYCSP